MTHDELRTELRTRGVPESLFSLNGLKDGECHCVVRENGTWKVVYMDRGKISELASGLTQSAAYEFVYKEFQSMYGWKN